MLISAGGSCCSPFTRLKCSHHYHYVFFCDRSCILRCFNAGGASNAGPFCLPPRKRGQTSAGARRLRPRDPLEPGPQWQSSTAPTGPCRRYWRQPRAFFCSFFWCGCWWCARQLQRRLQQHQQRSLNGDCFQWGEQQLQDFL